LTVVDKKDTLSGNRSRRTRLLCLLYFCQGFPWGFATIALLATLSEAGHPKADTATVVALAILPWTFKFIWGPIIDSFRMPSFGVRRPWIFIAQLCMAFTLIGAATSGNMSSESTLMYLAWVFFVHNCFASLQDVATDSLAVDLLEPNERGRVNGYMWGSKLFGIAFGGAGMATVIAWTNLQTAVLVQAGITLAVLCLVVAWLERPGERRFPWSTGSSQATVGHNTFGMKITFRELKRALSHRTTATLVVVAAVYIMVEGLYDPLTVEYFVQHLGWPAERFARAQGTLGVLGELLGALTGGYLCDRVGRRRIAALGMLMMSLSLLTFALTSTWWDRAWYPHVLLLPAFKGTLAFTTVAMFALFMKVCWTRAAATQFTLYMAMANVGYAVGAKLNTWIEQAGLDLSLADFYLLGGLLALLPLILMGSLDPDSVEARGRAERAAPVAAADGSEP
jgi:PAT family beta-lactamase induction signal transducer AmpG